jgi:diphthamide synthase (EF-2-diphthine--ammonia ligase)
VLPRELAGRTFDRRLLDDLPADVDPCGERGEFHTFCVDGPGFSSPIDVSPGAVVERDGFVFADLVSATREPIGREDDAGVA